MDSEERSWLTEFEQFVDQVMCRLGQWSDLSAVDRAFLYYWLVQGLSQRMKRCPLEPWTDRFAYERRQAVDRLLQAIRSAVPRTESAR